MVLRFSDCCFDVFFFFKQKTAYEMRISDWSSDVCSSDLLVALQRLGQNHPLRLAPALGQAAKHLRHVVELTEHRHPVNVAPDAGALLIDGTKHFESAVAVARHLADEGFGGIAGTEQQHRNAAVALMLPRGAKTQSG